MSTVWLEMYERRAKGRGNGKAPQRRNPEATRQKLLIAARREFADGGLAGARVDEIAARAKQNGLALDAEPSDNEWGGRSFDVTEPTGFKITVMSHTM